MSAGTNLNIWPVILTLILVTSAPTFAGQFIYVDDDGLADFGNIQAAINDSNDGDTIIVAEGRYFENINFNGMKIILTSSDPCNPDVVAATIIDGNQNGSVVTFNSGEDANCVLNGFTITNGNAERGGGSTAAGHWSHHSLHLASQYPNVISPSPPLLTALSAIILRTVAAGWPTQVAAPF